MADLETLFGTRVRVCASLAAGQSVSIVAVTPEAADMEIQEIAKVARELAASGRLAMVKNIEQERDDRG